MELEGVAEAPPDIASVVAKTVELVTQQTIDIPRILVVPKGEVKSGFKPFQLKLDTLNYPAVSDELWIQLLHYKSAGDRIGWWWRHQGRPNSKTTW